MRSKLQQRALSFGLAAYLVLGVSLVPGLAQGTRARAKQPSGSARTRGPSRARNTPVGRQPEVQLERMPPDPSVENADVAITAHVKAESLRFEAVPNPTVEFFGKPARDTVWESQRENLPTPVEPGVTYRNIGIRLKITSVFKDIDRIVAEALGEIPVTENDDSSQPAKQTSPETSAPATATRPAVNSTNPGSSTRPPVRRRP